MKYTEITAKSAAELQALLQQKKLQLFELRMKLKTMQLTNPNEIRETRRAIAQIKTAIAASANA